MAHKKHEMLEENISYANHIYEMKQATAHNPLKRNAAAADDDDDKVNMSVYFQGASSTGGNPYQHT
jgi:hypothetical protein